jgi:ubiquinone/menaquinone biosynthesis C-methylase UbiE
MYFGPLHFLLVREIVRALDARVPADTPILDLGCGTGVAGAAWALESQPPSRVIGVDRHSWAVQECRWTYEQFGVRGSAKTMDASTLRIPTNAAVIAAFAINELHPVSRERFHRDFMRVARDGAPVLVIEPIARSLNPWWTEWSRDWTAAGGRDDEWRFRVVLPEPLALMDKAAGLDHRELTGRSLWLPAIK